MTKMDISTQHYGIYCDDIGTSLRFYVDTLGFRHLFSADADENGVPLKMAWVRHSGGIVLELLQLEGYPAKEAALADRNHIALRVKDMDVAVASLEEAGIGLEVEPFDPPLGFDRPLGLDADVYTDCNNTGVQLRVAFFRGPSGERFELMQDNIGGL
jgi:catechol 2,3-dioxygenase-like lactoylglutathione lyase family enzyme